jgi:HNH endonuclease
MRCLFCKQDSSLSRSVEHIIPESLGGLSHTLPSGVVCDRCNNYFSHSVEKPFLESEAIELLRFNEVVVSKKGRVPPVRGILSPGHFPVTLYRNLRADPEMLLDIPPEAVHDVLQLKSGAIILPSEAQFPSGLLVSRFLAKVALEAMAQKLVLHPDGLEYLVDEIQLDPIRNHARRGDIQDWPVHIRRIYPSREKWTDESNREVQVVNEFDILTTVKNEWYFVLALFGTELVINYGGPETEGYQQWLDEHNGASPLYSGKNSNDFRLRRSS